LEGSKSPAGFSSAASDLSSEGEPRANVSSGPPLRVPDGSERYLVDEALYIASAAERLPRRNWTTRLPTTIVQNQPREDHLERLAGENDLTIPRASCEMASLVLCIACVLCRLAALYNSRIVLRHYRTRSISMTPNPYLHPFKVGSLIGPSV